MTSWPSFVAWVVREMNIVVTIKQVPDTTDVKMDPETHNLVREGVPSVINPCDLYALELACRLKESHGAVVTALSMGPPQAVDALREAIARGADGGILLSDPLFAGADTLATSYTLARAVRMIGRVSLVISGCLAADGETGQVPPGIAEELGVALLPLVSEVCGIDESTITVRCLTETGYVVVSSRLPAVVTVSKGANQPRFPTLESMISAESRDVEIWDATAIQADPSRVGLSGSPTRVIKTFKPDFRRRGQRIEGSAEKQAGELLRLMGSLTIRPMTR